MANMCELNTCGILTSFPSGRQWFQISPSPVAAYLLNGLREQCIETVKHDLPFLETNSYLMVAALEGHKKFVMTCNLTQ